MVGNEKICIRIQSQRNTTLESKEVRDLSLKNLHFSIHFLYFGYCRITENVWENQGFLKTDHGLLCTPDLVYCFFELISYSFQRESIKYMNSGRISWP